MKDRFVILRAYSEDKLSKALNKWTEEISDDFEIISTSLHTETFWPLPTCQYTMTIRYMRKEELKEEGIKTYKERKERTHDKTFKQAMEELKERHTQIYMDAYNKCKQFVTNGEGTYEQSTSWIEDERMKNRIYNILILNELVVILKVHKSYDAISDELYKELLQFIKDACGFSEMPLE
jgi:hypothetical protein